MIRIATATEPNAVTITIDGRLSGESVAAVYTRAIRAIGLGRAVRLFLGDITEIDENGRKLLSRLVMLGVCVTATESKFLDRRRNQPFAGPSKVGRTISYSEIGIDGTAAEKNPPITSDGVRDPGARPSQNSLLILKDFQVVDRVHSPY